MANWYHKRKYVLDLLENDKLSRQRVNDDDQVVTLCDDLIIQILLLLPAESLVKFQFVCKTWSVIINSPVFIKSNHENNKVDSLVVNRNRNLDDEFCVLHLESTNYMSIIGGINLHALDSLNGLVLANTIESRFLLVNPVTRKHIRLPAQNVNYNLRYDNIYNLAFCDKSKTYKVVHLFRRWSDHSYNCETLTIGAKRWRTVDLPSAVVSNRSSFVQGLFFGGSLYWAFYDILVVMNVQDDKFSIKNMSKLKFNYADRLREIGGNLGIVLSKDQCSVVNYKFEVWFSDKANEIWTKKYDIQLSGSFYYYVEPIYCSRDAKEIIFYGVNSNNALQVYAYNLVNHEWRLKRTLDYEGIMRRGKFIHHRNTLVSWE